MCHFDERALGKLVLHPTVVREIITKTERVASQIESVRRRTRLPLRLDVSQ
jgi:hypothetical protein